VEGRAVRTSDVVVPMEVDVEEVWKRVRELEEEVEVLKKRCRRRRT